MNRTYLKGHGNTVFLIVKEATSNVLLRTLDGDYFVAPLTNLIETPDYSERPENYPSIPVVLCMSKINDPETPSGKPAIDNILMDYNIDSIDL